MLEFLNLKVRISVLNQLYFFNFCMNQAFFIVKWRILKYCGACPCMYNCLCLSLVCVCACLCVCVCSRHMCVSHVYVHVRVLSHVFACVCVHVYVCVSSIKRSTPMVVWIVLDFKTLTRPSTSDLSYSFITAG